VFAEKNPDQQVPIASLTKLMTALVAVEYINIEKTITITPDMIVKTSIPRLKVGEQLSVYDLLQPLLKESSNEAAVAISDFLGPKYFVSLMNQTAQSVGMTNTHFVDPSGSGWGNVSTAHDLFMLSQYLYDNRSFILKMDPTRTIRDAYGPSAFTALQNFNVFVDDPSFVGGKVGINGGADDTILSVFQRTILAPGALLHAVGREQHREHHHRPSVHVRHIGSNNYTQDGEEFPQLDQYNIPVICCNRVPCKRPRQLE